jgi:hypothetical protein
MLIATLTKYLIDNKVYLSSVVYENGIIILNTFAQNDKYITSFINDVVMKEHITVLTKGYQKTGNFYQAEIEIRLDNE